MRDGALGRPAPPARPSDCGRSLPEAGCQCRASAAARLTALGAQVRYATGMSDRRSSESSDTDSPHSAKLRPSDRSIPSVKAIGVTKRRQKQWLGMSAAGTVLQLSESSQPELFYSPPQLSPSRALEMPLALNVGSAHFMSSVTSHSTNKRGWPAPMTKTSWSPSREASRPSVAPAKLDACQRPLETALARGAAKGCSGNLTEAPAVRVHRIRPRCEAEPLAVGGHSRHLLLDRQCGTLRNDHLRLPAAGVLALLGFRREQEGAFVAVKAVVTVSFVLVATGFAVAHALHLTLV
jgi:hypothetical protein